MSQERKEWNNADCESKKKRLREQDKCTRKYFLLSCFSFLWLHIGQKKMRPRWGVYEEKGMRGRQQDRTRVMRWQKRENDKTVRKPVLKSEKDRSRGVWISCMRSKKSREMRRNLSVHFLVGLGIDWFNEIPEWQGHQGSRLRCACKSRRTVASTNMASW